MSVLRRSMLISAWPQSLIFRSSANTGNASTITKPSGIVVGDLVLIICQGHPAIATSGGTAWSVDTSATNNRIYWKIIDATDVANTWTAPSGTYAFAAAYTANGQAISSVVSKSSADATVAATSITIPGFAPGSPGRARLVIAAAIGTDISSGNVTPPSTFTERAEGVADGIVADAQQTYGGQNVTFTGFSGTGSVPKSGWLLEVH